MSKKDKIRGLLQLSKDEVSKYNATKNELYLYQASEKIWMAYTLLVELLAKKEIKTKKGTEIESWRLISESKIMQDVFEKANELHSYHYEGRINDKIVITHIRYVNKMIGLYL